MSFRVVIPARYASTRLPGKPLLDIAGKPMLQHVWERACRSGAESVFIATDDPRIVDVAQSFGAQVCMTGAHHRSGTERLAEVAEQQGEPDDRVYVNVQGDEPLLAPELVRQTAEDLLAHPDADIATLAGTIDDADTLFDAAAVKVVTDAGGYALYFSRAPIPWDRDAFAGDARVLPPGHGYRRHIGLYAYRVRYLREHATLPPAWCEQAENLEQLRALHAGRRIHVADAIVPPGPGVDTAEDLDRVRRLVAGA